MAINTALLIVDVQQGMDDPRLGSRNNPDAERRMAELLNAWRKAKRPVLHVQHMSVEPLSPLRPELPGNALKEEVRPLEGEALFQKEVNSAFIGTGLEKHLRDNGISTLVIAGLTTDHCVSATARMGSDLGFRIVIVGDATATFERLGPDGIKYDAELIHRVELAALNGEFASVKNSAEILAEL